MTHPFLTLTPSLEHAPRLSGSQRPSADVLDGLLGERRPASGNPRQRHDGADGREHLRLGFDCPIRWSHVGGGVDRRGLARDASESGAGFTVRAISRPEVGQSLRLVFELDDDHEWIVDEAAVVARCDPRPDGLCDVGVVLREINM